MRPGIKITDVKYAGDYKLAICFSDKKKNIFDYKSLVTEDHEEFKPYLDITKFKKFRIMDHGTSIGWGKHGEMLLPLHVLYSRNRTKFHSQKLYLKKNNGRKYSCR